MRGHSFKVTSDIYRHVKSEELSSGFLRKAIYEAVRIIEEELGLMKRLSSMVGADETNAPLSHRLFEIELTIAGDDEIHEQNKQFRHVDSSTDILSFPAWEDEEALIVYPNANLYLGELVISIDTARRQAAEDGVSLRHMTAWLIAHGLLHLTGFDHPTEEEREIMRGYELKIVRAIGFGSIPKMAAEPYAKI